MGAREPVVVYGRSCPAYLDSARLASVAGWVFALE